MSQEENMSALVVEDDQEMAFQLKAILGTKYGLDVDVAADCASARERLAERYYDLVTVNFVLPDGHGLDLLQEITSTDGHPPVIIITGQGAEETAARSMNACACGYVVKGIRLPAMLSDAVEKGLTEVTLKRVEDALREEKSFTEAALNSIQDIFFVVGLRGRGMPRGALRWNARVGEVTGYTEQEIASMTPAEFFVGDDLERVMRALGQVADTGRAIVEAALVTKDGGKIPYEWTAALMRDSSGSPIGSCGVGRDISERKHAEEELAGYRDRLEELVGERTAELERANEMLQREIAERKRAEKELRRSKDTALAFINSTTDSAMLLDADYDILAANESCARRLKITLDELVGKNSRDVLPEKLADERIARLDEVFRTGRAVIFEDERNGMQFQHNVSPVFDESGKVVKVAVFARDIGRLKRAELELLSQKEHYRSIIENSMDLIGIFDSKGKTIDVSPSVEAMFGYSREEFLGLNVFGLVHPDDLPALMEAHNAAVESQQTPSFAEGRMLRADGKWLIVEAAGRSYTDAAGELRIVVNVRDVTARKKTEEALRRSEEKYRSIFTLSPDLIFIVEDGKVTAANPAMIERTGLTPGQLSELNFMEFFAGDNLGELEEAIAELFAGREVRGLEVRARAPGSEAYYFEISATPLFENGKLTGALCLARDVTKRHEAEEDLLRLNDELDGYARTVSHDLRTPLTAIKLASETLQRMLAGASIDELRADTERFGEVINLSIEKAESLIDDLLSLARAGQQAEEVSQVDVRGVVDRILGEQLPLIQEKGVSVEVDDSLGHVLADATHVYQVFSNLIGNAIRHNDNATPSVKVLHLGESPSRRHTFLVCDNGPGVPLDDLEDIFMPFVKGESGDTGIGLTIVDRIVKHYGGNIQAYNNHGACFEFSLPGLPG